MIDPTVSALDEQQMRAANMVEQIKAALRDDEGARARKLYDAMRADHPEQAAAIASGLRGGTR